MSDPIRKIELKDGRVRYRFVVDVGRDPETGRRTQLRRTFDTLREARAERSRMISETSQGTFVRPRKLTVEQYLDQYLEGATRNVRPSTKRSYNDALAPVRARLGARKLQDLTKADVEGLVTWLETSGRKRGGKAGTGLGARSIRLTLGRLTAALEMAQAEGLVARNVAKLVTPPRYVPTERETWSADEVQRFLGEAADDRLHAAWRLSLYGLRRGEVLGLRWEDLDLEAGTLSIRRARVLVEGQVLEQEPKTRNGVRTLPLDDELLAALHALKLSQKRERLAAGEAYDASGHVVVDELGAPVHPEWYSDEFGRVAKRAGVKRIVLHEGRHTALSLMEKAGVPISIVSRWAGHYDASFTYRQYVHADHAEDLVQGTTALGKLYKIN
ncbi:tyrosine recombinase XerC [Pseudonocardia sp. H11422]|uniref:site-specific integrase n=1 Tax=Pseudonocardia sp. H11422 TaxID=2835866 RepID=UPI001BDC6EDF|nr:tyrosine-type recombinase/integrase [Pseudonocardia sp. H11422]